MSEIGRHRLGVVSVYLGEVGGAGVLDLADVSEHGDPVLVVEGGVSRRHLKDQHTSSPPATPRAGSIGAGEEEEDTGTGPGEGGSSEAACQHRFSILS